MYAFVHFNMNTFTGKEWGEGSETPARFDPSELDVRQWTRTFKDAGMTGVIITAKHHDGFCLWPSAGTEHSVKNSPWRDGKGDLLAELSRACAEDGLLFGVYLSPWDRNHPDYGNSEAYNAYFVQQLREVCSNYGPLFEVWFDGACGEGPNGRRQVYDWPAFHAVVRELQPDAVMFSDAGPDIRWVGNERGYGSETNWAPFRRDEFYPGIPGREAELGTGHRDGEHWVPAEVDVSIRPGWYWRQSENDRVKSLKELEDIWYASIGRGCNLLLNVPPDRRGLVAEPDVARLRELRDLLDRTFVRDLAKGNAASASNVRGGADRFSAGRAVDGDPETAWATDDGVIESSIEVALSPSGAAVPVNIVDLREAIAFGQRVDRFRVDAKIDGAWREVAAGTTIGPRRILRFPTVVASDLRIAILAAKGPPMLATIEAWAAPPTVAIDVDDPAFLDRTSVRFATDTPGARIHYTLDGSQPTSESPVATGPVVVTNSCRVRAVAALDGRTSLYEATAQVVRFDRSAFRQGIQLLVQPKPGLRLRRFDGTLAELAAKAAVADPADVGAILAGLDRIEPAATSIVEEIALPKDRPADSFALVFDGYIEIPTSGIYTFSLRSDDGSRLFIADEPVCDADAASAWESREGRIPLEAGTHRFRLAYYEDRGEQMIRARWSGPGFGEQPIPADRFGH
jgi:alpha-L-fucosidase